MNKLQEDKLVPIVIDLSIGRDQINESFLRMFGASIELIIKRMFGLNNLDFKFRGPRDSLDKLGDTIAKEREYIKSFSRLGLNNPSVINDKWKLQQAINAFEKETGIKWPLK